MKAKASRGNDSKSMKPEKKFYASDKKGSVKGEPKTGDLRKMKKR